MKEILLELSKPTGFFATLIGLFYAAWELRRREEKKRAGETVTHEEIVQAQSAKVSGEAMQEIEARWKKYADDIEDRLMAKLSEMSRREGVLENYILQLRRHIADEVGPPPPDYPPDMYKGWRE